MSKRPMQQHSSMEEFQVRRAEPFHLATFLYNAEKGTVMNRDKISWCKFFLLNKKLHNLFSCNLKAFFIWFFNKIFFKINVF